MKQWLKKFIFGLLGKDPKAVIVVSFWTGPDALVLKMVEEIRTLLPAREHYVVSIGRAPAPAGCVCVELKPGDPYLQLRRALRRTSLLASGSSLRAPDRTPLPASIPTSPTLDTPTSTV